MLQIVVTLMIGAAIAAVIVERIYRPKIDRLEKDLQKARQCERALELRLRQCQSDNSDLLHEIQTEKEARKKDAEQRRADLVNGRVPLRFYPRRNCKFTIQSLDEDGNIIHTESLERMIFFS